MEIIDILKKIKLKDNDGNEIKLMIKENEYKLIDIFINDDKNYNKNIITTIYPEKNYLKEQLTKKIGYAYEYIAKLNLEIKLYTALQIEMRKDEENKNE